MRHCLVIDQLQNQKTGSFFPTSLGARFHAKTMVFNTKSCRGWVPAGWIISRIPAFCRLFDAGTHFYFLVNSTPLLQLKDFIFKVCELLCYCSWWPLCTESFKFSFTMKGMSAEPIGPVTWCFGGFVTPLQWKLNFFIQDERHVGFRPGDLVHDNLAVIHAEGSN